MFSIRTHFERLFGGVGAVDDAPRSLNLDAEVAITMVRAQAEASFTPNMMSRATCCIVPATASLAEIQSALEDCDFYWSTCYPETDNDLVEYIEAVCLNEIERRMERHGTLIRDGFISKLASRYQSQLAERS